MKHNTSKVDKFFTKPGITEIFLRLGLAVVLIYAAVSSTISPNEWIGYLPPILTDRFDTDILLKGFSIYEMLLALWLMSGIYVRYAALLCAVTLAGIVISNFSLLSISFRDIGLMFAALALAFNKEIKD